MPGSVLIADGDSQRAKRIEEACAARGFTTHAAPHGPSALEAALAEIPELIVAPFELDLIDALKLAEILRANPRTGRVRFVFLGRAEVGAGVLDVSDEILPESTDPDEVARRVEALLARRAEIDEVGQQAEADVDIEGKLSKIALVDLLQLFNANGKTGTLELHRRLRDDRDEDGIIHLQRGEPVQATAGSVKGEKALFRLLAWTEGAFAFTPRRAEVARGISTPLRTLLLEGIRQLDEANQFASTLPSPEAHVTLRVKSGDLPSMVHPLTQEVLLLLEIYSRVQDVVDHCSFPDYQVLRTLHTLIDRGMVELRRAPAQPQVGPAEGLFAPAQARRLRDWLEASRSRGEALRDAKLLLVSSSPAATAEFVRLLRGLAGARLEGAFAGGTFSPEDLIRVGRLPVDAEVGLELIQLPARDAFAPLWPAAGHGALAAVVLLTDSVDEAAAAVAGPVRALRVLPRARIFYALLSRDPERHRPEELRQRLGLLDDASLFLVPLSGGREPSELLRGVLAGVLP